jgi:hypothetical protein
MTWQKILLAIICLDIVLVAASIIAQLTRLRARWKSRGQRK